MKAQEIAARLGGHRNGQHGWLVKCPAHEDKRPSLSIRDGRDGELKVRCFGGCEWSEVKDALRSMGLLEPFGTKPVAPYVPRINHDELHEAKQRERLARSIWRETHPASGTLAERYMRSRGLDEPPLPPTLRFHPSLKHPEGGVYPALVAGVIVEPRCEITAIHRTYLSDAGEKADLTMNKLMLGNCRGGAVRLGPLADTMLVAEGIETTYSAMRLYGMSGWAALSAAGIEALILPASVRRVVLCADQDKPTAQHPRGHGIESCHKAADRFEREGRLVEIRLPQDGLKDLNDVLRRRLMPQP